MQLVSTFGAACHLSVGVPNVGEKSPFASIAASFSRFGLRHRAISIDRYGDTIPWKETSGEAYWRAFRRIRFERKIFLPLFRSPVCSRIMYEPGLSISVGFRLSCTFTTFPFRSNIVVARSPVPTTGKPDGTRSVATIVPTFIKSVLNEFGGNVAFHISFSALTVRLYWLLL